MYGERVFGGCNNFPPLPTGREMMWGKVRSPCSIQTSKSQFSMKFLLYVSGQLFFAVLRQRFVAGTKQGQ